MKHLLKISVIAAALALPYVSTAQTPMEYGSPRYPVIDPATFTPEQKTFAEEMMKPPRNGNVNNPGPFRVYFRSPEFGLRAIEMSDYLRWGTGLDDRVCSSSRSSSPRAIGTAPISGARIIPTRSKAGSIRPSAPTSRPAAVRPR